MDPQHLKYYERELQFMREMGAEYAKEFPKMAGRLGIDGIETSDPYVERLLEGFAFLSARVHLRLDAEYPKFTQNLLEIISPQYLTQTPSTAMVQIRPIDNAGIEDGFTIPRDTSMRANLSRGQQTACEFRTVQDVTLWPIEIANAEYFSNVGAYNGYTDRANQKVRAGLRIKLKTSTNQPLNEVSFDSLLVYLSGQSGQAMRIYEQIFGNLCGIVLQSSDELDPWVERIGGGAVEQIGFDDSESLLPVDQRTFSGYRLLREYFIFPERFLFARFVNLSSSIKRCFTSSVNLVLLFDRYDPELENRISAEDFSLHCTPVINLFPKRLDNINVSGEQSEYHLVADRTRPMDFEVFSIDTVTGYSVGDEKLINFLPFYSSNYSKNNNADSAYYCTRRARRKLSSKQKREGTRTSYVGSETYISLVDGKEATFSGKLKQLQVRGMCTNRDLPLSLNLGGDNTDFTLETSAPVEKVCCIGSLNRPLPSLVHEEGDAPWRLINMLSLNYLSLVGNDSDSGTGSIRELLSLLAGKMNTTLRRQIDGIVSVKSGQVTRRIPATGPIAFGKGLRIELEFEEAAFTGTGVFLLGAMLERFFARLVSINSFTETVIRSTERGDIKVWPVRIGKRHTL